MSIINELSWRHLIKKIINPEILNQQELNTNKSACIHINSSEESLSFKILTKIMVLNILNKYNFLPFIMIHKNDQNSRYLDIKKFIEKYTNVQTIEPNELEKIKIHFYDKIDWIELNTQNKTNDNKSYILIEDLMINENICIVNESISTYKIYKFLLSQSDENLENIFKKATILDIDEINAILDFHNKQSNLKYGQQRLAETIISYLYTNESYQRSKEIDLHLIKNTFDKLSFTDLQQILSTTNVHIIKNEELLSDFLIKNKIINSIDEFHALIKQQSILVNNEIIKDKNYKMIYNNSLLKGYFFIKKNKFELSIGKIE